MRQLPSFEVSYVPLKTKVSFSQVFYFCSKMLFFRFRAFLHGFTGKASLDRCIDNVCHFPSEEALYLLTDASMTHRVDPDSLDTIDEVFVEKLTTNVLVWCAHPLKVSQYPTIPVLKSNHIKNDQNAYYLLSGT